MSQKVYPFAMEQNAKLVAKNFKLKNKTGLPRMVEALNDTYRRFPSITKTMEPLVHRDEYIWLTSSRDVYFFESAEVANQIRGSSCNILNLEGLYSGPEAFILAIPHELEAFRSITGLLVTVVGFDEMKAGYGLKLFDLLGFDSFGILVDDDLKPFAISVNYRHASESSWYRMVMPPSWIQRAVTSNSYKEFKEQLFIRNKFDYQFLQNMSEQESRTQFEICKLVIGAMLYMRAMPWRISEGFGGRADFGTSLMSSTRAKTIKPPTSKTSSAKNSHYRGWFFRQLVADRYYRGEYATLKKGSRIIFVSDTMVNLKANLHTIREGA